jgi:hypothetical protein
VKASLRLGLAAALFLLPGCGAVLVTAMNNYVETKSPQDVTLSDHDADALVLILAEPATVPYTLHITQFDERHQKLALGRFASDTLVKVTPSGAPVYLAKKLEPGTYVYSFLADQVFWATCFQANTRNFTVTAGDAIFLGAFQPDANLKQIEQLAAATDTTTIQRLGLYFFYNGIKPPQITSPITSSADFLSAKNYETASMPSLHGRLQPVVYQTATFQTGTDLAGHPDCVQ